MPSRGLNGRALPLVTELDLEPWARGPAGTVPTEGFDVDAYFAEQGERIPEDPSDIFRHRKPPQVGSNGYYYTRLQMSQAEADDPAYKGAWGRLNIWNTSRVLNDHVVVQAAVLRGEDTGLQTVEAGIGKWPSKALSIFTYFTTVGYADEDNWVGGFNAEFLGWVQQSTDYFPGQVVSSSAYSVTNGAQYESVFAIEYVSPGKWHVWVDNQYMGYYARCHTDWCNGSNPYVFSSSGLRNRAAHVVWQGEVYDSFAPNSTLTDMGSGAPASEGSGKAAYIRDLWTWPIGSSGYQVYQDVNAARLSTTTDSTCYSQSTLATYSTFPWNEFFYGGPGKTPTTCNY